MLTVYVEDINDNKPVFMNAPYSVTIDETTPFGSIVFQDIQAVDRDQPNTPNSDIQYFIGTQTVGVALLSLLTFIYCHVLREWINFLKALLNFWVCFESLDMVIFIYS